MTKIKIEYRQVESLTPYARNARTHSGEQVAQIAASIKEFGFNNPILLDGENGVIAGHGRLLAARKLGIDSVPCVQLAHLSDAQRRAYILADNRLALNAGWDIELLKIELADLKESQDLALIGFDPEELADIMYGSQLTEDKEGDDIVPAGEENVLVRLSFPSAIWLSKREEILGIIAKMETRYLCQKSLKE